MAWLADGFLMLTAAGCARPDWIEQTLVTVDVTGVWRGSISTEGAGSGGYIELALQQSGPKVTGRQKITANTSADASIEGTVTGDIFRFRDARGRVTGELQVNGDEMTGPGTGPFAMGTSVTFRLRRQP